MRRAFVVLAVIGIAAVLPVAAHAASWKGVVVAKDPSRNAVVTASHGGLVRTVRLEGKLGALRIGQRIAVRARPLADGTFASRKVRVLGRAKEARIRAVVVNATALRTTVSAGGTVFALRGQGDARRAQSADEPLEPGDRIVVDVLVDGGSLDVEEIEEVGHSDSIKLEGRFVGLTDGVLELRMGDDVVQVVIPEGMALPDLQAGAEVSLRALVGEDGSFRATEVWLDEDGPAESEAEVEETEESEAGDDEQGETGEESEESEESEEPGDQGEDAADPGETDEEHDEEAEDAEDGEHADEPAEEETDEEEVVEEPDDDEELPESGSDGEPDGDGEESED